MKFTEHKINCFKRNNSTVLAPSECQTSSLPQREPRTHETVAPILPALPFPANARSAIWLYGFTDPRYCVQMELCNMRFLGPAYFLWHQVLKVHPCCGPVAVLPSFLRRIFHICIYTSHLWIHSSVGLFLPFIPCKCAALNVMHVCLCENLFSTPLQSFTYSEVRWGATW